MRLVSFTKGGEERIGALVPGAGGVEVVDLAAADPSLPTTMLAFLAAGQEALAAAGRLVAGELHTDPVDAVTLLAPVPRPGKIIGIGLNYSDHAAESGMAVPEHPEVFAKFPSTVIGHGAPIVLPRSSDEVDYEAELGVVIGRTGRHVAEQDAMDYVAGYVPFHDVSARDYQLRGTQWVLGKNFDTFSPMGPALVTRDEIPDPHALAIKTRVNGETLQDSSTKNFIFGIPTLIAELTAAMTLEPGDVIATGTPPGVGFARTPPIYLRPGDVAEIDVEGLGVLRNPVVAEA